MANICELAGYVPDPYQRNALDMLFAIGADGRPVARQFAIVACRQNIKTALFKMAALGWLFVTDQMDIVWSAHEFNTAKSTHRELCMLIQDCPELDAEVAHYYWGNGDLSIELKTGARLVFRARTITGGRGLAGDKVVLDEAFALEDEHIASLMPLLRTRTEGQLLYGSSAPKSDSKILHDVMKRGRAAGGGHQPVAVPVTHKRFAYLEYSAPEGGCAEGTDCNHVVERVGCALDNRENWKLANTALGRPVAGVEYETIEDERASMTPAIFARELLGWPDALDDAAAESVFGADKWEACGVPAGESTPERRRCFGLAVSLDRQYAAIGMAGERDGEQQDDGSIGPDLLHVEIIEHRRGTAWVAAEAKRLQVEHGYPLIVDSKGPASTFIKALEELDVEMVLMGTDDVCDAWAMLYDHVQDGTVRHMHYPEVDGAVAGAAVRMIGDRKALGRKASSYDICPLEAIELAAWGSWSGHGSDYNLLNSFF